MAKDAKPATEGVDAPPAKNNKKLFIIIAILVLVLGIGGVAAFLMLRHSPEQGDDDGEVAVEKVKPVNKKKVDRNAPPVYIALDAFTVISSPNVVISFCNWSCRSAGYPAAYGVRERGARERLRAFFTM